jgi:hypothetical protein
LDRSLDGGGAGALGRCMPMFGGAADLLDLLLLLSEFEMARHSSSLWIATLPCRSFSESPSSERHWRVKKEARSLVAGCERRW